MKHTNRAQARKSVAKAILSNYHALKERRYLGDLDASDTLIDFERAVGLAKLTQRQAEALNTVYGADLTQSKAAEIMGVGQPNVKAYMNDAIEKIDDIYEMWAWKSGELSAEDFTDEEMPTDSAN